MFFAANSGARIGLAEEVKELFRVKWREAGNPQSGVDFLYLTEPDYERVKDAVKAHPVEVEGRRVYRIEAIVGRESRPGRGEPGGQRADRPARPRAPTTTS